MKKKLNRLKEYEEAYFKLMELIENGESKEEIKKARYELDLCFGRLDESDFETVEKDLKEYGFEIPIVDKFG